MKNGIKRTKFVDRAQIPFYIIKDKQSKEAITPPMFIEKDKVEEIQVYSDMLYREIAMRTNSTGYFDRAIDLSGSYGGDIKNLLKHNWIYDADMDICDRYISRFYDEYQPSPNYKLHKTYMDIEVDLMSEGFKKDSKGRIGYVGFPEENIAPCPVNIITLIDGKVNDIHTFIVDNPINKSQQDFYKDIEEFKVWLKKDLLENDGYVANNININVYDDEVSAIEAYFKKMHEIDPDYCGSWNQGFDIITMMNRLEKAYNRDINLREKNIRAQDKMVSVVADTKYTVQKNSSGDEIYLTPMAKYKQNSNKNIVDRIDDFTVFDGIQWVDQMLYFANIRKGQMRESYSLDAISNEELGKEKLDYTGYTIKDLAWRNFRKFVHYNIKDVVLLNLLEDKNLDMDMIQTLSYVTKTRHNKVFKKTISIKNYVSEYAKLQGFIMNNNKNAKYGNDSEYFEKNYLNTKTIKEFDSKYLEAFEKKENYGAYVGDPNLNDYCGIDFFGKPSMFIYENVFDEDFSSLYPSIIRAFNLDKNTQQGKFFWFDDLIQKNLLEKYGYDGLFAVSKNEEATADSDISTADLGTTLTDSLTSHDWNAIGKKFFDLPGTEDLLNELKSMKKE